MEEKEYLSWLSSYTEAEECVRTQGGLPYYLRVNLLKAGVGEYLSWTKLGLEETFLPYAFRVGEVPEGGLGNTIDYASGWMHTQSLSSMLPPAVLSPVSGETILDICAAPGSKTTQCAALMGNSGVIVANDSNRGRISALSSNLERLGVINACTMNQDGVRFTSKHRFDRILVDAPCSGLGSNENAHKWWDEKYSRNISALQTGILKNAFAHLKEGGVLVYSTCTYAKEENEVPVSRLLETHEDSRLEQVRVVLGEGEGGAGAEGKGVTATRSGGGEVKAGVPIPNSQPGLSEFGNEFRKVARVYPHEFGSEGFFVAKIRRT
ncbi:RsmB/NOP family class I SAM-dependent RNA methyltransferase [Candidatus Micrarchaeota archaeon]|nr:RsmB/NOP family class I SAM-dependent RNA methyltransferase [Candidatus Micrarchaeota archaeon]